MEAKYTKGPWGVRRGFSSGTYEVYPKRPGKRVSFPGAKWAAIATVEPATSKGESAKANAYVLAAAPEMLKALEIGLAALIEARGWVCEATSEDLECPGCPQCQMRAAIAKAHGGAK